MSSLKERVQEKHRKALVVVPDELDLSARALHDALLRRAQPDAKRTPSDQKIRNDAHRVFRLDEAP